MTAVVLVQGVSATPCLPAKPDGLFFVSLSALSDAERFWPLIQVCGYTMMGGQAKVEGDGLSIPNTLNMAVVTSTGYEKSNQSVVLTP